MAQQTASPAPPKEATLTQKEKFALAPLVAEANNVSSFMLSTYMSLANKSQDVKAVVVHDPARLAPFSGIEAKKLEESFVALADAYCGGLAESGKISEEEDRKRLAKLYVTLLVVAQIGDPSLGLYDIGITVANREAGESPTDPKHFRALPVNLQKGCMLRCIYAEFEKFATDTASGTRRGMLGSLMLEDPKYADKPIHALYYSPKAIASAIFESLFKKAKKSGALATYRANLAKKKKQAPAPATLPPKASAPLAPVVEQKSQPAPVPKKKPKQPRKSAKVDPFVPLERTRAEAHRALQLHVLNGEMIVPGAFHYVPRHEDDLNMSFFPPTFNFDPLQTERDAAAFVKPGGRVDSYNLVAALMVQAARIEFVSHMFVSWLRRENVTLQTGTSEHVEELVRSEQARGRAVAIETCLSAATAATVQEALFNLSPPLHSSARPLRDLVGAADKFLVAFRPATYGGLAEEPKRCALTRRLFSQGDPVYVFVAVAKQQVFTAYTHISVSANSIDASRIELSQAVKEKLQTLSTNSEVVSEDDTAEEKKRKRAKNEMLMEKLLPKAFALPVADPRPSSLEVLALDASTPPPPPPPLPLDVKWQPMRLDKSETKPFLARPPAVWGLPAEVLIHGDMALLALCRDASSRPPDRIDEVVRGLLSIPPEQAAIKEYQERKDNKDAVPEKDKWLIAFLTVVDQFIRVPTSAEAAMAAPPFETIYLPDVPAELTRPERFRCFSLVVVLAQCAANDLRFASRYRADFGVKTTKMHTPLQLAVARVLFGGLSRAAPPEKAAGVV